MMKFVTIFDKMAYTGPYHESIRGFRGMEVPKWHDIELSKSVEERELEIHDDKQDLRPPRKLGCQKQAKLRGLWESRAGRG